MVHTQLYASFFIFTNKNGLLIADRIPLQYV